MRYTASSRVVIGPLRTVTGQTSGLRYSGCMLKASRTAPSIMPRTLDKSPPSRASRGSAGRRRTHRLFLQKLLDKAPELQLAVRGQSSPLALDVVQLPRSSDTI